VQVDHVEHHAKLERVRGRYEILKVLIRAVLGIDMVEVLHAIRIARVVHPRFFWRGLQKAWSTVVVRHKDRAQIKHRHAQLRQARQPRLRGLKRAFGVNARGWI
jgi:hypothetical protein